VSLDKALDALEVSTCGGRVAWIEAHHADCVTARGCRCLWASVLELALGAQVSEELGLAFVLAVGNVVSVDPAKVLGAGGAPVAGDACSSAAARAPAAASAAASAAAAVNASPTASATTSAASVCSDCANCSKLGVGTYLVRMFVLHESSVKNLFASSMKPGVSSRRLTVSVSACSGPYSLLILWTVSLMMWLCQSVDGW
jgi:hypothetical protein